MDSHYLKCYDCGWEHEEDKYYTTCPDCNGFVEVILKTKLEDRKLRVDLPSIFKYQDYMPYTYEPGYERFETIKETPEFVDKQLSEILGVELIVKDETVLPTGTWKDKEGFISVYRLLKNKIKDLFVFSSGNTGTAIARSASIIKDSKIHLVIPSSSQSRLDNLSRFYDEDYVKVDFFDGSNDECIVEAGNRAKENNILAEGGFANYARREGIKLFALEHYLSDHCAPKEIDWYAQPIAGGIGIYSFYKACEEMGIKSPRMLGVQAEICAPMVNAWNDGAVEMEEKYVPQEVIPSPYVRVLRTRNPGNAYRILKNIMDKCQGTFNAVNDQEILDALNLFYQSNYFKKKYHDEGVLVGLEASTVLAGIKKAIDNGTIKKGSKVLLCVSGAAKKGDVNIKWIKELN